MCRSERMTGASIDYRLLDEVSQQFLRAVKMTHGDEAVSEVITALEGPLGKAWKDRVIIHKLSGNYQTSATISLKLVDRVAYESHSSFGSNKIPAIKTTRSLGKMGLVDAKRLIENAEQGSIEIIQIDDVDRDVDPAQWERTVLASVRDLRSLGFEVNYI